jgi:plasmid stability protein
MYHGIRFMRLTIELPDEDVTALEAKAHAHGVSAEDYARQIVRRELEQQTRRPISGRIRQLWRDMPAEVRARLPADGASQIDHYVYGLPKREP